MCNKGNTETDIVGGVAMIIYATKKRCCCILADMLPKKMLTAWMVTHETFEIVNESCNAQERTKFRLRLIYNHREIELCKKCLRVKQDTYTLPSPLLVDRLVAKPVPPVSYGGV